MQKIIHIIPRLGNGGAEKLILATATHYKKRDISIKVICLTDESKISENLRSNGIQVECILGKGRMLDIPSIMKLLAIVRSDRPNLLISHLLMANFFTCVVSCLTFTKHIPMIHNLNVENSFLENTLNFLIKLLSYRILCVSFAVKSYEDKYCIKFVRSKTRVLYNAIDKSFFNDREILKKPHKKNNNFNFVCSGRLVSQKRHKDLLYAFSKSAFLNNSRLTILGDGPLLNKLKKLADDLDISDKCIFTGYVQDVASYLDVADVFIYPSEREGNPLALIEALARNLPVILSDIDCHVELFPKTKNIFFKTHDIESLTDKINFFCKDNLNYAQLSSMTLEELAVYNPENYIENFLISIK